MLSSSVALSLSTMNTDSPGPGSLRRLLRGPVATILSRYTLGSALAFVASEVTLLGLLGSGLTGAAVASIAAWAAGAVVNYHFSRSYAWGRRGRSDPWRELLPFWAMSVVCLVASTWTSDLAHDRAPAVTGSHPLQLAFVGAVYLGTYGVLFVGKFLLFHFVIFTDRDTAGAGASAR